MVHVWVWQFSYIGVCLLTFRSEICLAPEHSTCIIICIVIVIPEGRIMLLGLALVCVFDVYLKCVCVCVCVCVCACI